jgi:salicylate hydroxylase
LLRKLSRNVAADDAGKILMATTQPIIIIGGGIGGLSTALALLQRGLDVVVYEQAAELREVGAGVQIGSNGTHVLYALGLEPALSRFRVVPPRRQLRHWRTGETWDWLNLGSASVARYGTPHILMHRNDLHGILVDAVRKLKPAAIKLGMRCTAVAQRDDAVTVRFATGEEARGGALVGADGIHSQVRQCLFGASKPEFTRCVAWRGLVAMERLPPHLSQLVTTNWLGPQGHVLHYPVRRGELMNFISIVERDDWQVESWIVEGTRDELVGDFRNWHADVHAFIENIETPYKWALLARGPMEQWSDQRITLLGDACHPTLPFLGQGAVMAIEDAYIVAACLKKYVNDPQSAFARYEEIRKERTAAVVRKSHENRKHVFSRALADNDAVAIEVARYWQHEHVRERLDWLYQYDATAIAV